MNNIIEVTGIIIKVMPVGEYDRRISILTKERGKIFAFARGARKLNNELMGVTRVFAYGKFRLYESRTAYNLQSARIENFFEKITDSIETTCYASYFMELVDYYSRENIIDIDTLKLTYISLLALQKPSLPHRLIRRIFELRLMVINGEYEEKPLSKANDTTVYTWYYIINTVIEKLYTFIITEESLLELEESMDIMLKKYIDRRMNSLDILQSISS